MDEKIERIARAAHSMNLLFCESIGDHSQTLWDDAPDWQRDSVRAGVRGVLDGSLGSPEEQHASWLAMKTAEGWTWGPEKDVEAKRHPAFVPYADLPIEQRAKNDIFRTVVTALGALSA